MSSVFNALHIGYTGLSTAQVGINTTGHNIVNAETEGYTRQRVVQSAQMPLFTGSGNVGNGVEIQDVKRVFDNFVFDRYSAISADKEYTQFSEDTLQELSTYFPEVDGVGIKADLAEYYNMWQTFADNPDNDAVKVALTKQTTTLTQHITATQAQVKGLQSQLNDQLFTDINQVNELAAQLAEVNRSIDTAEAGDVNSANDLRDRRNLLEKNLSRLIGSTVNQGQLEANIQIDSNSNTRTGSYTLSVNGFNIVDGSTFHPLHISDKDNKDGFYELSYERQDGVLIPMEESVTGGKVGAIFDLRGGSVDKTSGVPTDGIVQNVVAQLDAFAKGLVESTNNLYAASAKERMSSNILEVDKDAPLVSSGLNIKEGAFDVVVYDVDGNEVATRSIDITNATSMDDIKTALADDTIDDNNDGNANNDIDDFITFEYKEAADGTKKVEMLVNPEPAAQGYTFAIVDKLPTENYDSGTNFAGAIGLGRFLDGDSAKNITLANEYKENPTTIQAGRSNAAGDNRVALSMVQQQFETYNFKVDDQDYNTTIYGMFDITSTYIGISTNSAITRNETTTTQFNAVELEYSSTSKVDVDEELTNLIKYQTSYGAAAKVITTVDQMMQTLLGIKQ